jgi:hypothetical protein
MGILDEFATPWSALCLLNGDPVFGPGPIGEAPFGLAPTADAGPQPASPSRADAARAPAIGTASDNLGNKWRNWWFGAVPPTRSAHGDLPEADMLNDPVSRLVKGIVALPQRSTNAAQDSAAHMYGGQPYSLSTDGEYHDPLAAVTAETAMTMMGGASPFAARGAAEVFEHPLAAMADHRAALRAAAPASPPIADGTLKPVPGGTQETIEGKPVSISMPAGQPMAGEAQISTRRPAAAAAPTEAKILDSRSARLYNPTTKPPRPFSADYPGRGAADEAGRLQFDIDGRPLTGAHISGRRLVRGADEAILPSQFAAVSEGSTGKVHQALGARALPRGTVGAYREIQGRDGPERSIGYLKTLAPPAAEKVIAHELGDALDEMSGQISTVGLNTERRQLYNTLNTGQERSNRLTGPQHLGYRGDDIQRELMAEAIRASMINPNYIKTVAPRPAARIRASVNGNPRLNGTIQFNNGGAPFFIPPDQDDDRSDLR